MRILFVSAHLPQDFQRDVQGMYKRMRLFIDALKQIGELDMLFYVSPEVDRSAAAIAHLEQEFAFHWQVNPRIFLCPQQAPAPVSKLRQQGAGIVNFFEQGGFRSLSGREQIQAFAACLDRQPDAIVAHGLQAMCPLMLTDRALPPVYFDLDNIEHILFMRQIRQPPTRWRTLLYYLQVPGLCRGEQRAMRLARRTFVCSEHDRRYLADRWQLPGITVIPNAVAVPPAQPLTAEPTLLLLGAYHYFPNRNAANFLIEQIWPRIHSAMPQARLIIAGKAPEQIRSYGLDRPGVEFTGFVEDLEALYRRSRVVCCPIFSGGGTRVKLIEAAAYGKPIVATRIGAEGLEFADGQEYLRRDRAQEFADACLMLLRDQSLCERLGTAARQAALRHYDRTAIVQRIQQQIQPQLPLSSTSHPAYVYER